MIAFICFIETQGNTVARVLLQTYKYNDTHTILYILDFYIV